MNAADIASVPLPDGWSPENAARWRQVFERILRIEGGHSNNPADRGGETNYGISLRFLAIEGKIDLDQDGLADFDLNRDGSIDGRDIRLLTPANAEALYFRIFWLKTGFWSLPRPFDAAMFDLGVNTGTVAAGKMLQRALNSCHETAPLRLDGQIGLLSRRSLAAAVREGHPVLQALRDQAGWHYKTIVANDNSQAVHLKGWLKRASELGRV